MEFAKSIGYVNAGTVEFLVDTEGERAGQHVFIEMNPRIQVEHTVTEEVTDVDLVQSQMRIAAGETLADLGLAAGRRSGSAAPPCSAASRPRTRRPGSAPTPARSRPTARRAAPASASTAAPINPGAQISPHFDSMLAKLTCRGRDYPAAVARAKRALAEFRIRGVSTNIPFLQAVLEDPAFVAGDLSTSFIDERPQLLRGRVSKDRGTKILNWLADVTVNQPNGAAPTTVSPAEQAARHRPRGAGRRRAPASGCSNSARRASPPRCARRRRSR